MAPPTVPPVRVAVLITHPVHYSCALFRRVAREPGIALTVLFGNDASLRPHYDPGFATSIEWDVPMTDGFDHRIVPAWGADAIPAFWWPFYRNLRRILKEGQFDWLWIHGYNRPSHWLAMAWAWSLGIRVMIRDEAHEVSRRRGLLKRTIKPLYFAVLNAAAERFLAIGSRNAAYYRQLGIPGSKIVSVPYAVDNGFFQAEDGRGRAALRRELGLPDDVPVILFASRLLRRKHPDLLLEAFRRLSPAAAARHPHLVFVGVGEMLDPLKEKARDLDTVRFAGFRGQQELRRFYDLCEVFVLPSVDESWGLVVNEAMNLGKPVVVCDQVGSAQDLVRHGENGFTIPAGDVGALSAALSAILSDPEQASRMGALSRAIIDEWDFEADVRGLRLAMGLPPHPLPHTQPPLPEAS
ncbi:glycosyltransferase family 4 protein [Azospirillum sp. B506]|uniref:glycosyltransferase family 4 protein n=1 Tax=Azospirillum sp. B506 TaxID=137721 RepID=UPI000345BBD6|nr:glycosyltransferase family 4 protein [Azospirillum sp. B506]